MLLSDAELMTEIDREDNGIEISVQIPDQFTVETVDITAEIEAEAKIVRRMDKQDLGLRIMAEVAELNRTKNYSQGQFLQILADTTLLAMERLAYSGSLDLLKGMLLSYSGPWFTSQECQAFAAKIDSWFVANPEA